MLGRAHGALNSVVSCSLVRFHVLLPCVSVPTFGVANVSESKSIVPLVRILRVRSSQTVASVLRTSENFH